MVGGSGVVMFIGSCIGAFVSNQHTIMGVLHGERHMHWSIYRSSVL